MLLEKTVRLLVTAGVAMLALSANGVSVRGTYAYDPYCEEKAPELEKMDKEWRELSALNQQLLRLKREAKDKAQSLKCASLSELQLERAEARDLGAQCAQLHEEVRTYEEKVDQNSGLINQLNRERERIRRVMGSFKCPPQREAIPQRPITTKLDKLEAMIEEWTIRVDQCEKGQTSFRDVYSANETLLREFGKDLKIKSSMEAAIEVGQRVASTSEQLRRRIDLGRQAATKVCGNAQAASAMEKAQLDRTRAVARGDYDALKAQLESAIAKLKEPINRSRIEAFSKSLKADQDNCKKKLPDALKAAKLASWATWQIDGLVSDAQQDITSIESRSDDGSASNVSHLRSRLAELVKRKGSNAGRLAHCTNAVRTADWLCGKLSHDVATVDGLLTELNALDRRRQEALNELTQVLNGLESDYAATKKAVAAGKDCIDRAEEQQAACDPKDPECNTSPDTDRRTSDGEPTPDPNSASSESGDGKDETEATAESEPDAATTETDVVEVETDGDETESEATKEEEETARAEAEAAEAEADAARAEAEAAESEAKEANSESESAGPSAQSEPEEPGPWNAINSQAANQDLFQTDACLNENGPGYRTITQGDGQRVCMPDKAAADAGCVRLNGLGHTASEIRSDGSFDCIPNKSAANDRCQQLNNSKDYYAVNVHSDGSFDCMPSKAGASTWCAQNIGKGWYAGKINSKGTFTCYPGKSVRTADCRRRYGRGWRAGKPRQRGDRWTWNCHGPKRGTPVRVRPPRGTRRPPPVIRSVAPPRNCHRRPDGSVHCGSG